MLLNKPSFPISFTFEDAASMIDSVIKERYWTEFEVADVKLVYTPYWIFSYDSYSEGEKSIVSNLESGKSALNAHDGEINENIADLIEDQPAERISKPAEKYKFEIVHPSITDDEVKEIIKVRFASKFQVPKNNIILSGIRMVYVPTWIIHVSVAEGIYRFEVNAVTGEIQNEIEVPEREKGWAEITKETIKELKKPGAWMDYSLELIEQAKEGMKDTPIVANFENLFKGKRFIIMILLVVVILLFLESQGFF